MNYICSEPSDTWQLTGWAVQVRPSGAERQWLLSSPLPSWKREPEDERHPPPLTPRPGRPDSPKSRHGPSRQITQARVRSLDFCLKKSCGCVTWYISRANNRRNEFYLDSATPVWWAAVGWAKATTATVNPRGPRAGRGRLPKGKCMVKHSTKSSSLILHDSRKPNTERSPADRLLRAHVNYDAIERLTHQVTVSARKQQADQQMLRRRLGSWLE